jgi:chemotaxis protein methyltransferase CheR
MTLRHAGMDRAVDTLLVHAAEWSGFQPEGVAREAVRRALAHELAGGASLDDVMDRAAAKEPRLVAALRAAVGVRETYLFRHSDQFELIASRASALAATGAIRAWSAGCATGEETWSLASTLAASARGDAGTAPRIAVLGSDVHAPSLEVARAGVYRANSKRPSAPMLYPVVAPVGNRFHVLEPLRQLTAFVTHDLRDPAPGEFEVIFCRNVLMYFARAAARIAVTRLAAALAPGGLIVFGTMDVDVSDLAGLTRVGRAELMAFTNVRAPTRRRPTTRKQPVRAASAAAASATEAVALHRSALVWIELGGRASAERVLADLNARHPDYLPGILERALVSVRKGDHATAETWMKQVLSHAEALPADQLVVGLEPLPATFYCDAARAYLERSRKGANS